MLINVEKVYPVGGSVAQGEGVVVESGARVTFVGEYRLLADIAAALDAGEDVEAEVPEWACWRTA